MKTTICTLLAAALCITSVFSQIRTKGREIEITGRASAIITADQIVYQIAILNEDPYVQPDTTAAVPADIDCEVKYPAATKVSGNFSLPYAREVLAGILSMPEMQAELIETNDYSINPFEFHSDEGNSILVRLSSLESLQFLTAALRQYPFFIGRIQALDYSGLDAVQNRLKVEAVKNARETAEAMLAVAGARLGKVLKIVDRYAGEETNRGRWEESTMDLYGRKNSGTFEVAEEVSVIFSVK